MTMEEQNWDRGGGTTGFEFEATSAAGKVRFAGDSAESLQVLAHLAQLLGGQQTQVIVSRETNAFQRQIYPLPAQSYLLPPAPEPSPLPALPPASSTPTPPPFPTPPPAIPSQWAGSPIAAQHVTLPPTLPPQRPTQQKFLAYWFSRLSTEGIEKVAGVLIVFLMLIMVGYTGYKILSDSATLTEPEVGIPQEQTDGP